MSIRTGLVVVAVLLGSVAGARADLGLPWPNQKAPADARAWAAGAVICVGLAVAVELALKVLIILYFLRDAPRRGMDPTLWIIVAVFAEVIALIVYLCVRQPLPRQKQDIGG